MGSPKALLPIPSNNANSDTLLNFHIQHAKQISNTISNINHSITILIGNNDKKFSLPNDVIAISDYIKNAGALSCLLNAFVYCQNHRLTGDYILVASCDNLIGIDKLYNKLIKAKPNSQVIYLTHNDKDYPLLGLYRLDLITDLKTYLDNGERSVMKFLKDKSVQKIAMDTGWQNLANFNTLAEFQHALQYFNPLTQF
ncbi:hypothetical protein MOMA_03125 [Moraxella macacae 0408225]|uniref:MobA-like NTP transferase domain-containing protein n=2 Tax=Moraxella macacae TaxID=765840 RepID=L2F9A8_9GAMM|nr:hypothetical protein MOMA_03125 [Moraxella macacae 0408225]